jgi:hypothetical protein
VYLFPFDAYRLVCGLTAVPREVDEGSLIPFERGPAPTLPLGRSLYDSIEASHVLCSGRAYDLRCVVIDKSDRSAIVVDSLLDEIRIEEKKQDR